MERRTDGRTPQNLYPSAFCRDYISAHVLLNLLNELGKVIKCEACRAFYHFFAMSLIDSIIHEYEC